MSLFSKIGKFVGKAVKTVAPFIPGPIGAVAKVVGAGSAVAGGVAAMGRALPAVRSLPAVGKTIGRALPRIGGAIGTVATGVAIYDAAGNYLGNKKRSRRINPLNNRALMRALRRVEKVKSTMKRVNAITIRKEKC